MLVQAAATNQARWAAALNNKLERLITRRVQDEDAARDLRERLASAENIATAARASADAYRLEMEEVGALHAL